MHALSERERAVRVSAPCVLGWVHWLSGMVLYSPYEHV